MHGGYRHTVVGILGLTDTPDLGAAVRSRVTLAELSRRLPTVRFTRLALFGSERPHVLDGGHRAHTVSSWVDDFTAEPSIVLVDSLPILSSNAEYSRVYGCEDAATRQPLAHIVGGLDTVGGERSQRLEQIRLWHRVDVARVEDAAAAVSVAAAARAASSVTVADDLSRKHLEAMGVERDVRIVPDAVHLANRLLSSRTLARRRAFHEVMGWSPTGPYLVLDVTGLSPVVVARLGLELQTLLDVHPHLSVVVLRPTTGHDGSEFISALCGRVPYPILVPPAGLVEDVVAILGAAEVVVGLAGTAITIAASLGRPVSYLGVDGSALPPGTPLAPRAMGDQHPPRLDQIVGTLLRQPSAAAARTEAARLDDEYDRLADALDAALQNPHRGANTPGLRRETAELRSLRTAYAARSRQLVTERDALGGALAEARSEATHHAQRAALADAESERWRSAAAAETHRAEQNAAGLAAVQERLRSEQNDRLGDVDGHRHDARELAVARVDAERRAERLKADLSLVRAQLDRTEQALAAVHNTATMRALRMPRWIYGRLVRSRS